MCENPVEKSGKMCNSPEEFRKAADMRPGNSERISGGKGDFLRLECSRRFLAERGHGRSSDGFWHASTAFFN